MKKFMILFISVLFCFLSVTPAFAVPETTAPEFVGEAPAVTTPVFKGGYDISAPEYEPEIALLVNADTDTVIYSKNPEQITAPASLTKITTALVVLSLCKDLNEKVTCSYEAIHSLDGTGSSVAGLYENEVTTVEMLLFCLLLPSANDAAAVLAEHFGGTEAEFVNKMNEYVAALGCKNTHFANPHGLDDESFPGFDGDTQSRTTAYDMYLISKKALQNDTIKFMSSKYGKTMPATNLSEERYLYNTNALLNNYSDYYYEYAQGLKTGTTDKAGSCLITSATKDGYTYIAISMRGRGDYMVDGSAMNTAFLMCRYMLEWAFDNISMKKLADTSRIMGEVGVKFGRGSDYVALVPQQSVSAIVLDSVEIEDLEIKYSDDFPQEVKAPVEAGDVIGTAKLMYGNVEVAEVTLTAQQTVKKNYLWAAFSWLETIMSSKYFVIVAGVIIIIIIALLFSTKNQRRKKKRRKNTVEVVTDYSKLGK